MKAETVSGKKMILYTIEEIPLIQVCMYIHICAKKFKCIHKISIFYAFSRNICFLHQTVG